MRQSLRRLSQSRPSLPHHRSSPPFLPSFALVPLLLPDSVVVDHFRLASPVSCGADSDRFSSRVFAALGPCVRREGGWRCEVCEVFARERGGGRWRTPEDFATTRAIVAPSFLCLASRPGPARLPLFPGPVLRVRDCLFSAPALTHLAFSLSNSSCCPPSCPCQKDLAKREEKN